MKYSDSERKLFLKRWLTPKLRNISRHWPAKNLAIKQAKVIILTGEYFKNGKAKTKVKVKCNHCNELFEVSEIEVDHINPVIGIDGFEDWNIYLDRLLCDTSNLQILCKSCHLAKSLTENEKRKKKVDKKKKRK